MFVVAGAKELTTADRTFRARAGEILFAPEGSEFHVENMPDPSGRDYLAVAVAFDRDTIRVFRQVYGYRFGDWDLTPRWHARSRANITAALVHWLCWSRQFSADQVQARYRLTELLLLFAKEGFAGNLLLDQDPSWRWRVRQLVSLDPAKRWRAGEVCSRLAVSESSLRRLLRQEQTGFREILEEVRLAQGLQLVMGGGQSIGQIALACGYESQSRFSERFKKRHGMSPTELRSTQTDASPDARPRHLRFAEAGD